MIKGCILVFLLMTCFFSIIVSMYGHVNISSVWTCLCVYVRTSLVWLAAVSFRCPSSSCSLIKAGAPCAAKRKHCIRKCLPDIVLWPQCQSDIFSSEEEEKHYSSPETFPNPVCCRILSWMGGVVFSVFVLSSVIDSLLMGVTEIHTGYNPWLNTPA